MPSTSATHHEHMLTTDTVLRLWDTQLRTLHAGHWDAARRFEGSNLAFGVSTAVMSAIAGTAAFASLQEGSEPWMRIVAGAFSMLAAIASSAQTYYKSSEQAEKHRLAATKFGQLRRQLEQLMAIGLPPAEAERVDVLSQIRSQWGEIDGESPALPSAIYDRVKRTIAPEHPVAA
jgi:hypothetical protein